MINRPVVVGVAAIQQKGNFEELDEALILMDKATKSAIKDAGNESIKNYIDEIRIPKGFWKYRDPGKWIARNNNFKKNPITYVTKIGVLQQHLINEACLKISKGEIKASMILGGEARYKKLRSEIEKKSFEEMLLEENPNHYVKAKEDLYSEEELEQLGAMAVGYYAVIETALRKASNQSIEKHKETIARMYEKFSRIAAKKKNAWNEKSFTKDEILFDSEKNKMMAFPYNKLHCTSWNVNQSAALIICNEKLADDLDIEKNKRVYPIVSTENNHMLSIQQRPKLYESMGMIFAANKIKEEIKRLNLDISAYDLYSCFPAAIKMFQNSLDIDKSCPITTTGSMAFAGGPLNSFVLHSSVEMIKNIRDKIFNYGLVTGVSGMMTKQSFCVWGKGYKEEFIFHDLTSQAQALERPKKISDKSEGKGRIAGYTFFRASNSKNKAILYLDVDERMRKVVSSDNKDFIKSLEIEEWVGRKVFFKNQKVTSW